MPGDRFREQTDPVLQLEKIKTDKRFHRPSNNHTICFSNSDEILSFTKDDLLANDWEIFSEKSVDITASQFDAAWEKIMRRNDCHIGVAIMDLKGELGL